MTKAFSVLTALVAALVIAAAGLACSSGDETEAPAAAPTDPGAAPTAAPKAVADDDPNARGGATGPGEFGEYLIAQRYTLDMTVTSTKFDHRRRIPRIYSCSEDDISVPITWSPAPEGAVSIAVVLESDQNPGAPWSHWVLWGVPADAVGLPENVEKAVHEAPSISPSARQGTNDDGNIGWNGPCPPEVRSQWTGGGPLENPVKKYTFRVFALNAEIELGQEATKDDLLKAIDGKIIGAGEGVGEHVSKKRDPGSSS